MQPDSSGQPVLSLVNAEGANQKSGFTWTVTRSLPHNEAYTLWQESEFEFSS